MYDDVVRLVPVLATTAFFLALPLISVPGREVATVRTPTPIFLTARAALAQSTYEFEFGSLECEGDCARHEAGFRWAARRRLTHPDQCEGSTRSFIQGCRAFLIAVRERERTVQDN